MTDLDFDTHVILLGAEHERIAAALVLYDPDGTPLAPGKDPLWKVHYDNKEPIALSFGRIIALAGDHFTNLSDKNRSPICGAFFGQETSEAAMEARFTSMVDSMKYDKEGFLPALDGLIECEKKAVDIVERSSSSVKQAFHQHTCGIPTDKQFWDAASYGSNPLKDPIAFEKSVDNFGFMLSLYAWASYINADHFVSLHYGKSM